VLRVPVAGVHRSWHGRSAVIVVVCAALSMVTTQVADEMRWWFLLVLALGLAGVALVWRLVRDLASPRWLMVWPLGILLTLATEALLSPQAATLGVGELAVAFMLVGLSQPRGSSLLLLPPAVGTYLLILDLPAAQEVVRVMISSFVWVSIAEIPAALTQSLRQAQEEVARLAATDSLTSLPNRRAWDEALGAAVEVAEAGDSPLVVMMIDLDHFKHFNDLHGHLAGDDLLRRFALTLGGAVRAGDLVARWGGEEFALALPGCTLADAGLIAERVRTAVPLEQSCSIGLVARRRGEAPTDLVHRADLALYAAKHAGRNRVVIPA
jgi:diguanylate cyclase (GGDEF)-like protein